MNKVFTSIALAIIIVCILPLIMFSACSEKETVPLKFDSSVYSVDIGENVEVAILSGNGDYAVYSGDESMLLAGYSRKDKKCAGNIIITGLDAGDTCVRVIDTVTEEEVRLEIHITEP